MIEASPKVVSLLRQQLEHMSQKLDVKNLTTAAAGAQFTKDTLDRTVHVTKKLELLF